MATTGLAVVILVCIQLGTALAQTDARNNSVLNVDGDENVITLTSIENIVKKTSLEIIDQLVDEMRKGFHSLRRELKQERSRRQLLEEKMDKCISGVQQPEVAQKTEGTTVSSTTTSVPTTVAGGVECTEGFTLFEGHCYLFELTYLDLDQAREACIHRGAYLVSVNTQAEHDFLVTQIKNNYSTSKYDDFWIGLKLISDKLKWEDDTDAGFTAWGDGEPNCMHRGCGVFLSEYRDYHWEDANSRNKFHSVCEQSPAEEVTSAETTVSPSETAGH